LAHSREFEVVFAGEASVAEPLERKKRINKEQ
jgi:hypothetical protein